MADTKSLKSEDVVWRLWHHTPLVVRALLAGLAVAVAGIQVWRYLVTANLVGSPGAPWSVPVMALYLWLYWRYLSGHGSPQSTADSRRRDLRARPLSSSVWRWSLLAGGSLMAATVPLRLLLQRFVPIDRALPDFLQRLPAATVLSLLLMSSVVAGVVEEAAFRGYFQAPIERRHGPVLAIMLTTAVFVLVHLPGRASISLADLLLVALASVNYGILAHLTQSILPGMVLHVSGDATALAVLWWFQVTLGPRDWHPVPLAEALREPLFVANFLELAALISLAIWAFRKLAHTRHVADSPPNPSLQRTTPGHSPGCCR